MASSSPDERDYSNILGFFEQDVLAMYVNAPDKYRVETDNFEGRITIESDYYTELESSGRVRDEHVDIQFGYRTLRSGELAIVVFLPDLLERSKGHLKRWMGFHIANPEWTEEQDERFAMWVRRYLQGDWDVDNGPAAELTYIVGTVNYLTAETVRLPLFAVPNDYTIAFPSAQNTHRYHDAHRELYGYLIDGLSKECIAAIGNHMGTNLNLNSDKTVTALRRLLPLPESSSLYAVMEKISDQRGQCSHGTRHPAQRFAAFEEFTKDLHTCVHGMCELLGCLEGILQMKGELARDRQEAKRSLPRIVHPAERHYHICKITEIVGKTVEKVEFGFRQGFTGVHDSEAILLYFTDGSVLGIDTGSNAANISDEHEHLSPEDFHVSFVLQWVPPLRDKDEDVKP